MDQREVEVAFTAQSGALTVTAPPNGNIAPPGYYMLFLLNSSGVPSVATFVQLTAQQDFSVTATPSSRTVPPGTATTYSVSVTPSNGFNGTVTFNVSGLPAGATASFNPTSVTGSGSSTMTVTTSTTPPGTYPLTITATSGNLTHTAQVTLAVADFSLSASPSSQTVKRGSKTTFKVTVTALGPFTSAVTFNVASGLPARVTSSFSPTSVTGSGSTTLTLTTRTKSATGTYALQIKAAGGGVTHFITVSLTVQ
jgi:uncharacterized membrane protein